MLFILATLIFHPHATFAFDSLCADTELGKALVQLETQSKQTTQPGLSEWVQPIFDEAKTFSTESTADESLYERSDSFQAEVNQQLDALYKQSCISRVTLVTEKQFVSKVSFIDNAKVELESDAQAILNPATYLFNQNAYDEDAKSNLGSAEYQNMKQVEQKLDKAFGKIKTREGNLSASEHLLLTYSRPEINLLSNLFDETLTLLTATSTSVSVSSPVTHKELALTLTATDLANLAVPYLNQHLSLLKQSGSFAAKPVQKNDVLMAAFYTRTVDAATVLQVLQSKKFTEPKTTTLKTVGTLGLGVAKVVLSEVPLTAPFITFGTLLYDAIQSKKIQERNEANNAVLIAPRP